MPLIVWLSASRTASAVGACSSPASRPSASKHHAVGVRGRDRVVGDHDDGLAELADAVAQQAEHLRAGAGVEVAGRLVGEDDLGPGDQRPGDGDPLLLAAGQLRRAVPQPVGQAEPAPTTCVEPAGSGRGRRAPAAAGCSPRASSIGSRLNDWKTKPTRSRRSRVSARSSQAR